MKVQAAITLAVAAAAPFLAPKQDSTVVTDKISPQVESNVLDRRLGSSSGGEEESLPWADTKQVELYQDTDASVDGSGFAAEVPVELDDNENGESIETLIDQSVVSSDFNAPAQIEFAPIEEASVDSAAQTGLSEIDSILDNTRGPEVAQNNEGTGLEAATAMISTVLGDKESSEEVSPQQTIVDSGSEGGFWLRGARLNDVFQYLAQRGKFQFFHNSELEAPNFIVTGHLNDGDPFSQMEELGLMYGVTVYKKGNTVYAMNESQMAQLPTKPFQYSLKYLRANPEDTAQLRTILQPVLTPGTGLIEFESKTNTLIVIDNERRIEMVKSILAELDKPKQQIAIETRILRVTSSSRNRIGVDWSTVLGDGLTFSGESALNTLFNLPEVDTVEQVVSMVTDSQGRGGFTLASVGSLGGLLDADGNETGFSLDSTIPGGSSSLSLSGFPAEEGANGIAGFFTEDGGSIGFNNNNSTTRTTEQNESSLVLSPLQVEAVLRALNTGNLAQQESSPTMITEDNEEGLIQIIDRIPLIFATVTETDAGQNISEEVRYFIDENDVTDDPAMTREIGVTVTITPTILPDDTIRMKMRPRSAQITEFVTGASGNSFPRVNESTIDTIARVPNGYSLLVGGFYEETESEVTTKVPILGDIPFINFAFKSTDKAKEHTSLVFIVTPKAYSPVSIPESMSITKELHERHVLPTDHAWPDRDKPGFNYESNLPWTAGNIAGVYPETAPSSPLHPGHPLNQPEPEVATTTEAPERRRGLFKGLFKNKKEQNR